VVASSSFLLLFFFFVCLTHILLSNARGRTGSSQLKGRLLRIYCRLGSSHYRGFRWSQSRWEWIQSCTFAVANPSSPDSASLAKRGSPSGFLDLCTFAVVNPSSPDSVSPAKRGSPSGFLDFCGKPKKKPRTGPGWLLYFFFVYFFLFVWANPLERVGLGPIPHL
jgi:hypothetical protein